MKLRLRVADGWTAPQVAQIMPRPDSNIAPRPELITAWRHAVIERDLPKGATYNIVGRASPMSAVGWPTNVFDVEVREGSSVTTHLYVFYYLLEYCAAVSAPVVSPDQRDGILSVLMTGYPDWNGDGEAVALAQLLQR